MPSRPRARAHKNATTIEEERLRPAAQWTSAAPEWQIELALAYVPPSAFESFGMDNAICRALTAIDRASKVMVCESESSHRISICWILCACNAWQCFLKWPWIDSSFAPLMTNVTPRLQRKFMLRAELNPPKRSVPEPNCAASKCRPWSPLRMYEGSSGRHFSRYAKRCSSRLMAYWVIMSETKSTRRKKSGAQNAKQRDNEWVGRTESTQNYAISSGFTYPTILSDGILTIMVYITLSMVREKCMPQGHFSDTDIRSSVHLFCCAEIK